MYSRLVVALLATGWSTASADISDAEAIRLAKQYAIALGYEKWNLGAFKVTPDDPHSPEKRIYVSGGGMHIELLPDGRLASFSAALLAPRSDKEHFKTDEEVWRLVERLAREFGAEAGLRREYLERTDDGPYGRVIRVRLAPRPYGYPAQGGNAVEATFRRSDGSIREFTVHRGYEYIRPEVRIKEDDARRTACSGYGGSPRSWRVDLKFVPFVTRDRKLMRLAYILYREQPDGVVMVMVDPSDGKVLDFMRTQHWPRPPEGKPTEVVEGWEPNPGPDPPRNFGKPLPTVVYVAIVLTAVGTVGLALLALRRWFAR